MHNEHLNILWLNNTAIAGDSIKDYLESRLNCQVNLLNPEAVSNLPHPPRPDVVLLDDSLLSEQPHRQIIQTLKHHYPHGKIIILASLSTEPPTFQTGAFGYLKKPLDYSELERLIRSTTQRPQLPLKRATLFKRNLDWTLENITQVALAQVQGDEVALVLLEPDSGKLQLHKQTHAPEQCWSRHLKNGSLSQLIIQSGHATSISDTLLDQRVNPKLAAEGIRSFVGVPIPGWGGNLGVLYVYSQEPSHFEAWDRVMLLQTLAEQAGLAIASAWASERSAQYAYKLTALYQVSTSIGPSLKYEETLTATCRAAVELFGVEHSGLVLFEPSLAKGKVVAEYPALGMVGREIPVRGIGPEEELVDHKRPLVITNVTNDQTLGPVRDILLESNVQSTLIVPVVSKGRVLASFSLDAIKHPRAFSYNEISLCESFAAQVAVAIENALAHQLTKALIQTESRLSETVTQPQLLRIVWEFVGQYLAASEFFVALENSTEGHLHFPIVCEAGHQLPLASAQPLWENLARYVMETGREVQWRDTQEKHRVLAQINGPFTDQTVLSQSCLVLPLKLDNQTLGVICAQSPHAQAWDETSQEIFRALTNHTVVALRKVQLFQENHARQEKLRALYAASNFLVSPKETTEATQVLENVVTQARVAADAWWVSVILIDEIGRAQNLAIAGTDSLYETETVMRPNGLTMQVMQTGKPVVVRDTHIERARVNPRMLQEGVAAALCLPLSLRGRRIGVMWFHYAKPQIFSEFEIADLQLYVNQAAIAYDNARRLRELEHLRLATEKLASKDNIPDVLQQIVTSAQEVLEAQSSMLWSYDHHRHVFFPKELVAQGIPPHLVEQFRNDEPRAGGTAEHVIKQGYLAVTDIDAPPYNFLGTTAHGLRGALGVKAFQGVALRAGGEVLGVLYVNYDRPHSFNEDNKATLEAFAYHAALALKRVRLLAQVERTKQATEAVAGVTIQENLQTTLDLIAQHVQRVLQSDAVTLYAYDETTKQFGPWAMEIDQPHAAHAAHPAANIQAKSALWTILEIEAPPYYRQAEDNAAADPLFQGKLAHIEGIKAAFGIQLRAGAHKVGVLFVHYRAPRRFSSDETATIELFANQAAVAIRNAQLYAEGQRREKALRALNASGQIVSGTLTLAETLNRVAEQSLVLVGGNAQTGCFSHLALQTDKRLSFTAAYPLEMLTKLKTQVGEIDLDKSPCIGITGRVALTGHSVNVGDVTQHADYLAVEPNTLSELVVPIKIGAQVIGVINIEHPERYAFRSEDLIALENLAAQAAVAIKNAQLFENTRKERAYIHSLYESSGVIISAQKPGEVLRFIVAQAGVVANAWRVTAILMDDLGPTGTLVTAGYEEHVDIAQVIRPNGYSMQVMRTGQPVIIEDAVQQRALVNPNVFIDQIQAALGLPISLRGKRIGVMWFHYNQPRCFSESEIADLQLCANQAAITYDNARRVQEQVQLRLAVEQLAGQNTIAEVLQAIAQSAQTVMNAHSTMVWSYDATRQVFFPDELAATGLAPELVQQFQTEGPQPGGLAETVITQGYLAVSDMEAAQYDFFGAATRQRRRSIGARAFQGIALRAGGKVLGVLSVNYARPRSFTEEDKAMLETLAYHASLALQWVRLFEQVERTRQAARVVAGVTVQENLQTTLNIITQHVQQVLQSDAVMLYTYDETTEQFGPWASQIPQPYDPASANPPEALDAQSAVWAILRKAVAPYYHFSEDNSAESVFFRSQFVHTEKIKAGFGIQLRISEKRVGVMFINYRSPHRFSSEEIMAIELFANQAAVAIRNAQLLQYATRQERDRLREDVHDALNALHFKVMVSLEDIRGRMVKQGISTYTEELTRVWRFAKSIYENFYHILQDMRDPVLVERGLESALRVHIRDIRNPTIKLCVHGATRPSADIEFFLYRICQEAISNIIKHATQNRVQINATIHLKLSPTHTCLIVRDNGAGFLLEDVKRQGRGIGLRAMENWARKIHTQLNIRSTPGKGTRIRVLVPFEKAT